MQKRRLGYTDLWLTPVGLGTWAIGGPDWIAGWGAQDDDEAVAALVRGIDAGLNWIDTAAVYGRGHSETLIGRALRQIESDCPLIATKCGRVVQPGGSVRGVLSPDAIRRECEESLHRLGVEVIDLYQMHWPDPDEEIELAWETMAGLIEAGVVRHIGVSNFDVAQMRRVQAIHPIASLQPPYNMIRRGVEDETLTFCSEHGIGVLAYSPMAKGLLTGAFTAERAAALPEDDHRSRDRQFRPPLLAHNLALVDGLAAIAAECERTVAQLAIAWVLRRREVTSAIVGVRRPEQTEGLIEACQPLSDQEVAAIEELLASR